MDDVAYTTVKKLKVDAQKVLESGAVDLPSQIHTYVLPIEVLTAALEVEAAQWGPHKSASVRNIKNLKHFM